MRWCWVFALATLQGYDCYGSNDVTDATQPSNQPSSQPSPPGRGTRLLYLAFGWLCFALGALGVVLPLLPTTPFMLLAVWAFSRGSERLHRWLCEHPLFGPSLQRWRAHRVVSRRAKLAAVGVMGVSSLWLLAFSPVPLFAALAAAAVMASVATWLVTRPSVVPVEMERR